MTISAESWPCAEHKRVVLQSHSKRELHSTIACIPNNPHNIPVAWIKDIKNKKDIDCWVIGIIVDCINVRPVGTLQEGDESETCEWCSSQQG